jgi:hypothetical protein
MTDESNRTKHAAYRDTFKTTFDLAGAYARWLLSTLLLLNSGAIAGLFQKDLAAAHISSLVFFGLGVFAALASGIVGWFNLQFAASYFEMSSRRALAGEADLPVPGSLKATRIIAILSGITSIGFLAMGSLLVVLSLHYH